MTQYDAIRCNAHWMDSALLLQPVPWRMQHFCCWRIAGWDGSWCSEYMPATSIQKRSHPWQGSKSLGVLGNQLFTHQSSCCIQCVDEDDERILNHVIFHLVEFRCHSHLLAKSYYLRLASLFWTTASIQLAFVFSLASTSSNDIFWNRCHSSTRESIHFVVLILIGRQISSVDLSSWASAPVSRCHCLLGVRLPAKYCGYKRETKTKPLRFQSWRCCSTFLFASWRKRWLGLLAWPFNNTWISLRSLSMRHERQLCWPCVEVSSSLHCMLGDCGGGASRLAV